MVDHHVPYDHDRYPNFQDNLYPFIAKILEVKIPTYGKMQQDSPTSQQRGTSTKRPKKRSEKRRVRRKKMQACEMLRNTVFFQCFVAPEGKSRLARAAGAEGCGDMVDPNLHQVVARERSGNHIRSHFGGSIMSKVRFAWQAQRFPHVTSWAADMGVGGGSLRGGCIGFVIWGR